MKPPRSIMLLVVSLVLASCSWRPDPWRKEDTYRHAALTTLKIIDWQQTREISHRPNEYRELNPILGDHPKTSTVDLYFASGYLFKTVTAYLLPVNYRESFQWLCIGASGSCVANNYSIGLKGEW